MALTDPPYRLTAGGNTTGTMGGCFAREAYDNSSALFDIVDWDGMVPVIHDARARDRITATPNRWYMPNCEFALYLHKGRARRIGLRQQGADPLPAAGRVASPSAERKRGAKILEALGESNPTQFIQEAHDRGASAFLEKLLSLKLLHSSIVANGVWSTTRFDLFDTAIRALAHEHNLERATDPQPSAEEIVGAASVMCFNFLISGAAALWRSNSLPPYSTDIRVCEHSCLGV